MLSQNLVCSWALKFILISILFLLKIAIFFPLLFTYKRLAFSRKDLCTDEVMYREKRCLMRAEQAMPSLG